LKVSTTSWAIDKSSAGDLFKEESASKVNIFSLTPYLERWATSLRSPNRHILLLDGLDSIFLTHVMTSLLQGSLRPHTT
jgi:hypothetical protein